MGSTDNKDDNLRKRLDLLKLKNTSHSEELNMKCKEQKKIHNDLQTDFKNQNWTQCSSDLEKLSKNSEEIRQMMKDQTEITKDTLTLTEDILESLELSSKNKQILLYSDWVKILIDEIIMPGLDYKVDDWTRISAAFSRNIREDIKDADDYEFECDDEEEEELFDRLDEILYKVKITFDDFYRLVKLNRMRNSEFHVNPNKKLLSEAKQRLEMPLPQNLECFREPLKKALDAIEIKWNKPKKRRTRKSKKN